MTPQERQMVADLFDRLASLEGERRDPDAERVIREGLGRAPNAVYALVQSVLVQDEALKRANTRIEELEHAAGSRDRPRAADFSTACATCSPARRLGPLGAAGRPGLERPRLERCLGHRGPMPHRPAIRRSRLSAAAGLSAAGLSASARWAAA